MDIKTLQLRIKNNYARMGFANDLSILTLGLCEEAGEICKAVNLLNPKYVKVKESSSDSLEHEIADILVYIVGIANSAEIDLDRLMEEKTAYA